MFVLGMLVFLFYIKGGKIMLVLGMLVFAFHASQKQACLCVKVASNTIVSVTTRVTQL